MEVICWLILVAIFIVIEIATLGLTTIWFAGGAFVAAIVGLLGANLIIQIICFVIVSALLVALTRPIALKYLKKNIEKTNIDAIIGKKGIVITEINNLNASGSVKIDNMEWTARSKEGNVISIDSTVEVIAIEGVKLIVIKVN